MSAGRHARFVYLTDGQPPQRGIVDTAARQFGWWLVTANNRAVARAARSADSMELARESARNLHRRRDLLTYSVGSEAADRQWRWVTSLDDELVAASTHGYARRAECSRALEMFLSALPAADPESGVVWHRGPAALRDLDRPVRRPAVRAAEQ